ncbi:hypothetical protein MC7420_780 [Coleofasciculus chthonoplastes PCC 7420]|uniref:Uncharacterized protein n=1 Tax=Coleofasciculus chthonoplastes PCC 7420 TaxID=118168 RepID=B4VSU7_9CYAN|nr:hypothetical protein [Coleofasciculus chthonoplastes]EDX74906.1 hypothetical protein MC7420_780 [Coleofasciculus chthonoplastes PCC 7420]
MSVKSVGAGLGISVSVKSVGAGLGISVSVKSVGAGLGISVARLMIKFIQNPPSSPPASPIPYSRTNDK